MEVWGPLAERAASEVRKGTRVLVEGRLKVDSWADKATGAKRSAVKVRRTLFWICCLAGAGWRGIFLAEAVDKQTAAGGLHVAALFLVVLI